MRLVHWHPLQEFVARSNGPNPTIAHSYTPPTEDAYGAWAPPVDIFDTQDQLVIRAEVPGVQKDDIDVRIENGVLTLHGQRVQDADVTEENAHRLERLYGAFTRSFSLPTTVDATRVTATYKDGILEVTAPKAETAKPKRIEINTA